MSVPCETCGVEVVWAEVHATGQSALFEAQPHDKGLFTLEPASDGSLIAYGRGKGTAPLLGEELRHRKHLRCAGDA